MPKTDLQKKLGRLGERLAENWLYGKGYRLVRRNYTLPGGQIDLIMYSPQGNLVIFEIKTRRAALSGLPMRRPGHLPTRPPGDGNFPVEHRIGPRQLMTLRRAAGHFLTLNPFPFTSWQLDLLWITLYPTAGGAHTAKIRHYQDVLGV